MDSNRGVDFIVLPAGKSEDGKPDSRNPQAWGLKRKESCIIYSENRLKMLLFMYLDGSFY